MYLVKNVVKYLNLLLLLVICCLFFGVVYFVSVNISKLENYYNTTYSKIFPSSNHIQGLSSDQLKKLNQTLQIFDENVSKLDYSSAQLQKRLVITMRDLYDEMYKDWKEFVDRLVSVGMDLKKVSFGLKTCHEKTRIIIEEIMETFVKKPTDNDVTYDRRIKTSIRYLKTEFGTLSNLWRTLYNEFLAMQSKMTKIESEAYQQSLIYLEKMNETYKGWSIFQITLRYGAPVLLMAIPGINILAPLIGSASLALGPTGMAIYHIIDTYKIREEYRLDYKMIHENYANSGDSIGKIGCFISDLATTVDGFLLQLDRVSFNVDLISAEVIQAEFLDRFILSLETLNKYSNKIMEKNQLIQNKIEN